MLLALGAIAAVSARVPVAQAQTTVFQEDFDGAWTTPPSLLTAGSAWSGIGSGAAQWHREDYLPGWSSAAGAYSPSGAIGTAHSARFHTVEVANGSTGSLITPAIDFTTPGDKRLSFWFNNATGNDRLDVFASFDDGATWGSSLGTFATSIGWTPVAVDLGTSTSTTVKVRLQASSDFGSSDIGVDNVQIVVPAPLGGSKTIGAGGDYATLSQAFAALTVNGPASGGVTFELTPGATFTEDLPALTVGGSAGSPVVFHASGAHALLLATGGSGTTDGAIDLLGADYVTFDGLDIGVASGSALEYGYFLRNASSSNGAQNNTIRNATITLTRSNTNTLGVLQSAASSGGGFTATSASGANSGNSYLDIVVQNSYAGMYLTAGTGLFPDAGCVIANGGNGGCVIGAASANDIGNGSAGTVYGIRAERQSGLTISGATVRNLSATSNNSVIGIWLDNSGTGTYATPTISGNQVSQLSSTSTSASQRLYGIRADIAASAVATIVNNDVFAINPGPVSSPTSTVIAAGIVANAGTNAGTVNVYFNSVRIDQTTAPNGTSAAFYLGGGLANLHNDIFANTTQGQTGVATHYAAYLSAGTIASSSHNIFYAPNANGVLGRVSGVDRATLESWAAATSGLAPTDGAEAGSILADPNFAAPRTLPFGGPTPAALSGIAIAGITTDIAGATRGAVPTIGSHETAQAQVDAAAPTIGNVTVVSGALPSVSATIDDNNAVAGGIVRLWYRLGATGAFAPLAADTAPGGFAGVYTWEASLQSLGPGLYQFYLTARDGTGAGSHIWANPMWTTAFAGFDTGDPPNFAANPASYANVRTFSLTTPLAGGTYEVGDDQPVLQKLSDVATQLASATLTGDVVYELNASYDGTVGEALPVVFTAPAQSGGPWSVTVRVKAGAGARTTSGSSSSATIIVSGAARLTLDGREGGTGTARAWTITNTSTAGATAAVWLRSLGAGSGAHDDTLRYLSLRAGADQSVSSNETFGIFSGGQTLATTSTGEGNDANAFVGNAVTRARWGVFVRGGASTANSGVLVQDNIVGPAAFGGDQIGRGGIVLEGVSGARVAGNEVRCVGVRASDPVAGVDRVGIALGAHDWVPVSTLAASGCTVTANRVHDIADEESFSAVGVLLAGSGSSTANVVAQNMVWSVRANGTSGDQAVGIGIAAGDGDVVAQNSVALSGDLDPAGATSATMSAAAVRIATTAPANLTLADNALSVDATSNTSSVHHYAIAVPTTSYAWGSGRCTANDYFAATGNAQAVLGGVGSGLSFSDVTTLAAWRTQFGGAQDAASVSGDPRFVDQAADLHAQTSGPVTSALANGGVAVSGLTTDIDGETRNATTPDIGADEFATFPLTLSVGAHGTVSKSPDFATYNAGTVVTLTATPDLGYSFDGFTGDLTGTASPQTLTMDAAKSVGASFTQLTYTLTPSAGAHGAIAPAEPVTLPYGASQTFTLTPDAGYRVEDVLVDGASVGAVTSYSFTSLTASHTISASFTHITHTVTTSGGAGGTVSPLGAVPVNEGDSLVVTITPDAFVHVADVLVDGVSVGPVGTYTFSAVQTDHTLQASFARDLNDATLGWPSGTIVPAAACVDVPVTIARTSLAAARLYSVTVQLSANLTLCGAQATKGDYLTAGAGSWGTQFYIVDNGGGSYTIDETILGDTCTAVAPAGTLFTLHVTSTDSTGTGTIGFGDLRLRGCANDSLPLFAGSGTTVTIANTYTLTASAGAGGSVSPSGVVPVGAGSGRVVTMTPDAHYHVADVLVDGASVGAVTSYTFANMSADHTLAASFAPDTFTVVASAGAHGTVSPAGAQRVVLGGSVQFDFAADPDYHVDSLYVDGVPAAVASPYTFSAVDADHTLHVTFAHDLNDVSVGAAAGTITVGAPCVQIPVTVARTNLSPARLYSVTVRLSANLTPCDTLAVPGGYLAAGGGPLGTGLFVTDHGDHTYTIDETILGSVCGATQPAGTLFYLQVTSGDSSGTGTVEVLSTLMRDCDNHDLPLFPGSGGSIAIDNHYLVTVTQGAHGTIAPGGVVAVGAGGGRTFAITPDAHYHIANVIADGIGAGAVASYAFVDVHADHTLTATFAPDSFAITATAGAGGSVSPAGSVQVAYLEDRTFTFAADPGFHVGTVLVDGIAVPSAASYTFTAVTAPHTLAVSFDSNGTNTVAGGAPSSVIALPTPCVSVPVTLTRTDPTPLRRYRVTVQLSANLSLCGAGITAGSYLSAAGPTAFSIVSNGGGSYTVAESLTASCGATGNGTLFTLAVASADTLGSGSVSVVATDMDDCGAILVPSLTGVASTVVIDKVAPSAPVTGVSAAQSLVGNGTGGTTSIAVSFTLPAGAADALVYRAPYGNYPLYDDAPNAGSVPVPPVSYPPAAPWTLTGVTASGGIDAPPSRDVWYYVAFARDAAGNVGPVSAMSDGTLDYHLGDVSNGITLGQGDNAVNTIDLSLLGAHYGVSGSAELPYSYLDIGPTTTGYVDGRPLTDGKVNFEDFILMAINFDAVSAPRTINTTGGDQVALVVPAIPGFGQQFTVQLRFIGVGDVQGVTAQLGFDPAYLRVVSTDPGSLLDTQSLNAMVLSSTPGSIDVALLGSGAGITGGGILATVTFQVMGVGGHPMVTLSSIAARDAQNHAVALQQVTAAREIIDAPAATALGAVFPNPVRDHAAIGYALRESAPVRVEIFDAAGRLVRALDEGVQAPGVYTTRWDGRDASGRAVANGTYALRFRAGAHTESRRVLVLR